MLASIIPGANVRAVFLLPRTGSPQRFQFGVWPLGSGPCHFPLRGRHLVFLGLASRISANTPYRYPIRYPEHQNDQVDSSTLALSFRSATCPDSYLSKSSVLSWLCMTLLRANARCSISSAFAGFPAFR